MTVREITSCLETWAPLTYAEDFDNVGLLVGSHAQKVKKVLIAHDALEEVIDEAIAEKCELVVCFHPIIFRGLKKLTDSSYVSRAVTKAIKHDISIYAIHTALDVQLDGVNAGLANALGLKDTSVIQPAKGTIQKLNTYVPNPQLAAVQEALFAAGAGAMGHYDECSFAVEGEGGFKPLEGSKPFVGTSGFRHTAAETQLQMIFPKHLHSKVITALLDAHPYETVAYEITTLENSRSDLGMGCIGELPRSMQESDFLKKLKDILSTPAFRHSALLGKGIKRVAILGGSGSFAIESATAQGADAYITADLKYHDFFRAEGSCLLVDVGHYESEQFTKTTIMKHLNENFPNFAFISSKTNTNPVHYF